MAVNPTVILIHRPRTHSTASETLSNALESRQPERRIDRAWRAARTRGANDSGSPAHVHDHAARRALAARATAGRARTPLAASATLAMPRSFTTPTISYHGQSGVAARVELGSGEARTRCPIAIASVQHLVDESLIDDHDPRVGA